jgi:hypothetical protein
MSNNIEENEPFEILKGFLLLCFFHCIAVFIIFILSSVIGLILGGYAIFYAWIVGGMGFFLWQLIYVLPLTIRLKRRGKIGIMKGVIICAALTALMNGSCYLVYGR